MRIVAWPEVSQYWYWQSSGWGQVPTLRGRGRIPKWCSISTSVHMVKKKKVPQNGCHQCLCYQGELQLPTASLRDSPVSAREFEPGSLPITASALGPGVCEIFCVPLKNGVSISFCPLVLLKVSHTGLKSQMIWVRLLLMPDPQFEESAMRRRTITHMGEF